MREPRPDKRLPAIREALSHPRDVNCFDADLPVIVEQARAEGDWRLVEEFTHLWWVFACDSMQYSEQRQRMWETVNEAQDKIDQAARGEP